METNPLDPREILAPIYAAIEREKAGKTFVQVRIHEWRKYGDPLELDYIEPDELARHVKETERGPDSDIAGLMCDALNDIDSKERKTLNKLVTQLLVGKITVEQQQELNALIQGQMCKHGLGVVNRDIARAV